MKLPAFQFYVGDWRKDPGVQSLSFHDRGVWFEILCLMHESERRGVLLLGSVKMPDEALARLLGLDNQILTTTITTLLTYGVASVEEETGALISRRMIRDEHIRQIRIKAGKQGGNPNLLNQKSTTKVKQKTTPSSSSSISSSKSKGSLEELKEYCKSIGLHESDGDFMFHKWEESGWKNSGNPVKDWKAGIRKWKSQGWLPSQKVQQLFTSKESQNYGI